jgi:hypothetical protein
MQPSAGPMINSAIDINAGACDPWVSVDATHPAIDARSQSHGDQLPVTIAQVVEWISATEKANYLLRQELDRKTGRFARRANQMVVSKIRPANIDTGPEHCGGRRSFSVYAAGLVDGVPDLQGKPT